MQSVALHYLSLTVYAHLVMAILALFKNDVDANKAITATAIFNLVLLGLSYWSTSYANV